MWVFFAFGSAIAETVKDVLGKTSTVKTNEYATAFWMKFLGLLILVPVVLVVGIPHLAVEYYLAVLFAVFTVSSGNILYMRAIKLSPLSVSIPLLSFNPVFVALLSYVFFREVPTLFGWLGILLVSAGLYMMRLTRQDLWRGLLRPILSIREEPGAIAMLGVGVIWGIGGYASKLMVVSSTPLMAAFGLALAGSAGSFLIGAFYRKLSIGDLRRHMRLLLPMGIADSVSEFAIMAALSAGIVPYVVPIKRTNIALSSVAGKFLFGERLGRAKLLGIAMILAGIFAIIAL